MNTALNIPLKQNIRSLILIISERMLNVQIFKQLFYFLNDFIIREQTQPF